MSEKNTRVGVACFIFKDGKFLMGQRKGSHGDGSWSIPGGHLEFGEQFEETAAREAFEETGLKVKNVRFGALTNDFFRTEEKHYISIWMISDYDGGEEQILEPETYINQKWFGFDNLPSPLFLPWQQLLKSEYIDSLKLEALKTKPE
jgi:8-oxo-dGTP diphosphatase